MEIVEGVHRIDEASANIAHSNVYLVIEKDGLIVIDTGTSGNAKKIVDYIQKIGHQPSEVAFIVLTHFHMDHVGSAKELKDLIPNAKIAAHEDEAEYISGKKPLPKPKNMLFRAVTSFIKLAPVEVEIILKERSKIGNLNVIHVPGHTPGSICLLDEERKVLFAGDTLRFDGKKISGAPEQFSMNPIQVRDSIIKMSTLIYDVMLPGHGEPLKPNASNEVKKFIATLK